MATPVIDLDGFMSKFESIWKSGLDADLLLGSISGKATVTFSNVLSGNPRPREVALVKAPSPSE